MTKIDTKEILEIAYAFKTAQWGTPQPIKFLPQAHKFGEDVFNLIEAYDEAQKEILVLNEFVREITFKLPLLKFDTANHAQMANDLVQKTVDSIVADKAFEKDQRISTLEALLREIFREVIDSDTISFETFRSIQKELGEG